MVSGEKVRVKEGVVRLKVRLGTWHPSNTEFVPGHMETFGALQGGSST